MGDIDIIKAIDHLENNTSWGVDGISNSLLKSIKLVMVQPITAIIQKRLQYTFFLIIDLFYHLYLK